MFVLLLGVFGFQVSAQENCPIENMTTEYNADGVEVVRVIYACSNGVVYSCTYVLYNGGSNIVRSCSILSGDWIPIEDPVN